MKFKLFRRLTLFGPRWYFHIKAANHRIIAPSEGYRNKADAEATIDLIKREAADAPVEAGE